MELGITIEIWKKEKWFIAKCPELDFISQGQTKEDARNNILEVIKIQFEEMTESGTLGDYLEECGFKKDRDHFVLQNEMISLEKYPLQVN